MRAVAPHDVHERPQGVLDVTRDSFSDGGRSADTERAVAHVPLSVDTSRPEMMRAAVRAGARNLTLLRELRQLTRPGAPLMVGLSRKGMVGAITGRPVGQRLPGSLAAAVVTVRRGATVLRVHDVGPTRDVLAVLDALHAHRTHDTPRRQA